MANASEVSPQEVQNHSTLAPFGSQSNFDEHIYDTGGKYDGYLPSFPPTEQPEDDEDDPMYGRGSMADASASLSLSTLGRADENDPLLAKFNERKIQSRENAYQVKGRQVSMKFSPPRHDPFLDLGLTPQGPQNRLYADVIKDQRLELQEKRVRDVITRQVKEGTLKRRWERKEDKPSKKIELSEHSEQGETPGTEIHDNTLTPGAVTPGATPGTGYQFPATPHTLVQGSATPGAQDSTRWSTPKASDSDWTGSKNKHSETPTPAKSMRKSRWDLTLSSERGTPKIPATPEALQSTPGLSTPGDFTPRDSTPSTQGFLTPMGMGSTPTGMSAMAMATPAPGSMTPEQIRAMRWNLELGERNRFMTDDELDSLFPQEGYTILKPPEGYKKLQTPTRRLQATPTPAGLTGFHFQAEDKPGVKQFTDQPSGNLPFLKQEDIQYFGKLLEDIDEDSLPPEEQKELKIMRLLLKIKNGTPPMRKSSLRQITDKAREFGAAALFNQILPLLMSPALEDQERHLLVKVIDRILYKLDDLVRPFVHKILVVIEPLLIDEDYFARVEGREIISNLAKAAGLATMISTMRPDIDNIDEYVRNTTARAFAVVASALGIPSLLPFLKAVCRSKKSWQARHTGIKIVQQIAILMGCAILPYLKSLVDIIEKGLVDEQQKVRTITALALAALAEAATPYGIESFDSVLVPLWKGIRTHRGKGLAAFLKAIGFLIPLMDNESSKYYTREVMLILVREFTSPDEETKKIVLKVVKQCCATDGVEAGYIRQEVLPHFFKHFWNQRVGTDRRNHKQLVDTTVEIANKVGGPDIIRRIVDDLKEENENYRKMVMECIEKILMNLGASDIDARIEEQLIDGIMYAFQEQSSDDVVMLSGFGVVVNALGTRVKPYLPQICGTVLWRLNNPSPKIRQQAADLISKIAAVMKACMEEKLMGHLGVILYEYLGEEYPEVLGSILAALKAIVNVIGMTKMTPPIKDLLPRLTPILKNRHEKVQENCIDLVGRIADRGADFVQPREWMRICVELLDLLKAHKKAIRRATVNTFGYIAKAIGPQDVLATLLTNLRVQERQNRVCTTVAIAIVAETCSPFTVIPGLMNEYRLPELNVQHGVLKSMSFLFEYIGEMGKDYIYAVTPLLEDALMDRDLVHRQTSCSAVKHMALGVYGLGCEDALRHLLNFVWPNIFESSPHMVMAVKDAIEGLSYAIGPSPMLLYLFQGLMHPARKIRDVYWRYYNCLYISFQDALVPAYPSIENDEDHTFSRYELLYSL